MAQSSPFARLRGEERIGLGMALAAHLALVAALLWHPPVPAPLPEPARMTVTLAEDAAPAETAPEAAQPAPAVAPILAVEPALPEPRPVIPPVAQPVPRPVPQPLVKAIPALRPAPLPAARAATKPQPAVQPKPAPATSADTRPRRRPDNPVGGSLLGSDFLKGVPAARATGAARAMPAAAVGPQVLASLSGAIARQLKPRWSAPQGVDADQLVTVLAWSLNADGSLAGAPRVVRQEGITDANRAQASRHAEQAVRAVQLAAPFTLPPQYYDQWKRVASFRFDRRLSQ